MRMKFYLKPSKMMIFLRCQTIPSCPDKSRSKGKVKKAKAKAKTCLFVGVSKIILAKIMTLKAAKASWDY